MRKHFSWLLKAVSRFILYDPYGVTRERKAIKNFNRLAKVIEAQNSVPLKSHFDAVGRHIQRAIKRGL